MSKFKKKKSNEQEAINTSSLPDIIFMLLFFFMVSTTMKEADVEIDSNPPIVMSSVVDEIEDQNNLKTIWMGYDPDNGRNATYPNVILQMNDNAQSGGGEGYVSIESAKDYAKRIYKEAGDDKAKLKFQLKADTLVKVKHILRFEEALKAAEVPSYYYGREKPPRY